MLWRVGGASVALGAMRGTFWGALAMALTAGVGKLFVTGVRGPTQPNVAQKK